MAALALTACGSGDSGSPGEPIAQRQQKLVHQFSLPIPVGMHPENLVLGATETIHINDRATIRDGAEDGNVAGLGGQNVTGFDSRLRSIWSGGSLLIRQSVLTGYYKAGGTVSVQQGAPLFFGDPEENRSLVPVRQDPIWKGIVSTSNLTNWFSLEPQEVLQIAPGARGNWSIKSGATLILNAPGIYNFHGLFLEPSASVILPATGVTQIIVDDSMILRAPLGNGVDTILGYFGQGSLQVEAPFDGQLILAPMLWSRSRATCGAESSRRTSRCTNRAP